MTVRRADIERFLEIPVLHAGLYPLGTWADPCEVRCDCGFTQRAETCDDAIAVANTHDRAHHTSSRRPGDLQ